jgi:hypothetical protein
MIWWHWSSLRLWNLLPDPLLRPGSVEVMHRGVEHTVELLLMQDEQMIEALMPHTPQKAFTDGIGSRGVKGCLEELEVQRF